MLADLPEAGGEDAARKIQEEIQTLVEWNNQLNEETVQLVVRAEAIEKLKGQQSFLEHLRASKRFVRPE
jgi:hypothetical protein